MTSTCSPEGAWYDFFTDERVEGRGVTAPVEIEQVVRHGTQ